VFDVQGHHLELRPDALGSGRAVLRLGLPAGELRRGRSPVRASPVRSSLEELFLRSDNEHGHALSAPHRSQREPASRRRSWMRPARTAELVCGWEFGPPARSGRCRTTVRPEANLDEMEANAARYPIAAWKVFTSLSPDAFRRPPGKRLAARRSRPDTAAGGAGRSSRRPATPRREDRLRPPRASAPAAHNARPLWTSPFGPRATFPDVAFIVYHSGVRAHRRAPRAPIPRRRARGRDQSVDQGR